ncbi:MAG: hypothetical protein AAFR58_11080 [Cyanobacteria bacterium J06627_28]
MIFQRSLGFRLPVFGTYLAIGLSLTSLIGCSAVESRSRTNATTDSQSSSADSTAIAPKQTQPAQDHTPSPNTQPSNIQPSNTDSAPESTVGSSDTIEPTTLMSLYAQGLAVGMPYREARIKLIDQGWLPHTPATNSPVSDWSDASVLRMGEAGFPEVKTCSGRGPGVCKFEFVLGLDRSADNGAVLSVLTTPESSTDPTNPGLLSWGMQNEVNTTYADQPLDAATFEQLRAEGFCQGVGRCPDEKYAFSNVLLWSASGEFGSTRVSIFPRYTGSSLSQAEALVFARMLDADNTIDFEDRRTSNVDNSESYYEFGTPQIGIAEGRGGVSRVRLSYQEDGDLSEIAFESIVF